MQYIVTIQGNDGFYREHAGYAPNFHNAVAIAHDCLEADQKTTIELLRITAIKEHRTNQQEL